MITPRIEVWLKDELIRVEMHTRMKISVIRDISILWFYGYIRYIEDISADILEKNIDKPKIDQNL